MQNQPLSSNDQGKLLIFSLLMVPSIIFLVGVIPTIFLAFGIYMMKKNQDFANIDTAVKNFKRYAWLVSIAFALWALYWGNRYFNQDGYGNKAHDSFIILLIWTFISLAYLIAVQVLFYTPLKKHCEWVEVNGIFSTKLTEDQRVVTPSEVDIIKGEKLKQYSVADELTKWAKLKENGHISEEEFNEARTKLLKRD